MLEVKWLMGDKDDLSEVYAIRTKVFVEEQDCPPEEEFDGTDGACVHLLMYCDEVPVSTGRIYIGDDYFKIGRVATLMEYRGRGLATGIMQTLIGACVAMGGDRQIIHAQIPARGFYEKLGFVAYGEEFEEAGIPHIAMEHFGDAKKCGKTHCGGCNH